MGIRGRDGLIPGFFFADPTFPAGSGRQLLLGDNVQAVVPVEANSTFRR